MERFGEVDVDVVAAVSLLVGTETAAAGSPTSGSPTSGSPRPPSGTVTASGATSGSPRPPSGAVTASGASGGRGEEGGVHAVVVEGREPVVLRVLVGEHALGHGGLLPSEALEEREAGHVRADLVDLARGSNDARAAVVDPDGGS